MGEPSTSENEQDELSTSRRRSSLLVIYMVAVCLIGAVGLLPIAQNVVLNPVGAGEIVPLLHLLTLGHGVWAALVWAKLTHSEELGSGKPTFQKTASIVLMFSLAYIVSAYAILRGAPFISTYLWSSPAQVEAHIGYVKPVKWRGACSNRLLFGIGRQNFQIMLKDQSWPNQTLCVDHYDGPLMLPRAKKIGEVPIVMMGHGNWLAFRMEQYQVE
ncbi:MAG TPA: hypothetical protein ENK34_08310 [Rhodobacteraceae bacterium]|nr:hypothetical protein [Paracoccaceae bacterium]